jgi:hypothetical protein
MSTPDFYEARQQQDAATAQQVTGHARTDARNKPGSPPTTAPREDSRPGRLWCMRIGAIGAGEAYHLEFNPHGASNWARPFGPADG